MFTAQDRLLAIRQTLGNVGGPVLPLIAAIILPSDLPLSILRTHLMALVDSDIRRRPVIATHRHRSIGADDLARPVFALRSIDKAGLDHRIDSAAVIEDE